MEVNSENTERGDAIYEGVLSTDDEGGYWLSQNHRPVELDTEGLNEELLERKEGEPVSIVGTLRLELREDSSILDYRLETTAVGTLEGRNPENGTYVTRLGDRLIEAYENGVEEFEGDLDQLITDIENVAY